MAKNLVIVESPAKAKTIEKFLGKDFKVESSFGHIRDLAKKDLGVDIKNKFAPKYIVPTDKKDVVNRLKKELSKAEVVWLASDEDREGEAIAWHLAETLGLNPLTTNRIVFHEITQKAIQRAIENPRKIDDNLVKAQQARRILDRLVGFELSPVLWRKVKGGLSAGRVQSVSVRLIVEREREIQAFNTSSAFRVVAIFTNSKGQEFKAELNKRFETEEAANAFLKSCIAADFEITQLEKKPAKKSPAAPFTTSTLQQEASRKLGFSVSQTMSVAQKLYESGLITYMRTDSLNLSDDALNAARKEITKSYGEEFSQTRKFSTKSKGAQEAHEAIRPTYMENHEAGADRQQQRLYDLIWKRTLASQMADAKLERTTAVITAPGIKEQFVAKGEVIVFEGFLKVYLEGTDDDEVEDKNSLPPLQLNEHPTAIEIDATERFSKHPPRYTEASLVKKLEELGIGRPSTYAPTISTIVKRQYVEKSDLEGTERKYVKLLLAKDAIQKETLTERTGADKGKLIPTDVGTLVTDFLVEHFGDILDYNFTANVEGEFDEIADGQKNWVEMLENFYTPFHLIVEDSLENAEKVSGERLLGNDPKSGKPIFAKIGRYGPMVQMGETESEEKPQFAGIPKNQSISTITLEEALILFKLPREVGEFEDKKIKASIGRFGPYIVHDKLFVSIKEKEGDDPYTIEQDRAIELILQKRAANKERFIAKFDEEEPVMEILKGPYGPYIKVGRKNYKIAKDVDPSTLDRAACLAIIEESGKTPPKKKAAPKKATASKAKKTTTTRKKKA
ncbi:MAG: type I DNA topoisomerase [Schleiferiaceae bacterium]|nr:type I DNA topoisomerase [Schleiferiaceae bacterium]